MKRLSTNFRPFFWLHEQPRRVLVNIPSTPTISIMWNWISHHKSQSKKANLLTPGERNSVFPSEECQRFFLPAIQHRTTRYFPVPSTINVQHIFCRCADWNYSLFISAKFSTHHTECWVANGNFLKSRNGIIAGCVWWRCHWNGKLKIH